MSRKFLILLPVLMNFNIVFGQCSGNLISNGSFNSSKGEAVTATGWTGTSTPDCNDANGALKTTPGYVWVGKPIPSEDGGTWQNIYGPEYFTQTFTTSPGTFYFVKFQYAQQSIQSGSLKFNSPAGINVYVNNVMVYSTKDDTSPYTWENACFRFLASQATSTIKFQANKNEYMAVDGVCIKGTSGNVGGSLKLGNDTAICEGDSLQVSAANHSGPYLWSNNSTQAAIIVKSSGTYWVRVPGICEEETDSIVVTVDPLPHVDLGRDTILCEGEQLNLFAPSVNGAYLWNDGSTQNGMTITKSGIYWLQMTTNCRVISDTIQVQFIAIPIADLGTNTVICKGQNIALHAGLPSDTILWYDGSNSNSKTINQSGTYWVRVSNSCGVAVDTVEIYPDIQQVNLGEDTTLCSGHILLLNAGIKGSQILWDNGSSLGQRVIDKPANVTLEVRNKCGVKSDTLKVNFRDCDCHPWFPDAFTADDNGLNDLFKLKYSCVLEQFHIEIFDRWGAMLFASEDPDFSWDGRSAGKLCAEGVYVFHVEFRSNTGLRYERRGTITLLR
ncbi:MAG: gliding motility-associated C-terminal domain-containing protein [Bacteroidetes bacterium]|nr:gliding motility-associated C-terminal domain-containing protein [Bacteroidota bacterium]